VGLIIRFQSIESTFCTFAFFYGFSEQEFYASKQALDPSNESVALIVFHACSSDYFFLHLKCVNHAILSAVCKTDSSLTVDHSTIANGHRISARLRPCLDSYS
jgi:hypothetical protein